jgi:hypothetical protein
MSLLLAAATLAQAQLVTAAPARPYAVPATGWACSFESADGARFRLSGRLDEVPAGADPNASRPARVEGDGPAALLGDVGMTGDRAGDYFREYQLTALRGRERYNINLRLRRGGAGVADITRYVDNDRQEPYSYFAAGICTSDFAPGAPPESQGQ